MAQRTISICDVGADDDVHDAMTTIRFGIDNAAYEIDLCGPHAGDMANDFAHYTDIARRSNHAGSNGQTRPRGNGQAKLIRAWAASNGIPVPAKGRIPAQITEQYTAAH